MRKHYYQGGTNLHNLHIGNCQINQMVILCKHSANKIRFKKVNTTKQPSPPVSHQYLCSEV